MDEPDGEEARGPGTWRGPAVAAGAGLFSAVAVFASTWQGIGANGTDSVAYLTMADDVAAGRLPYPTVVGIPPTHLPPGWSVLIGALVAAVPGADALSVARLLNVVFAGLLPIAVYLVVRYRAPRSTWIPPLMAVVVATSYPLFELASRAVVEPMFLVLMVATLVAIERVARAPSVAWLLLTSALVGYLTLTRFVGVAALVPLALTIVAVMPSWPRRLGWLAVSATLALAPTVAWYLLASGPLENAHIRGDRRAGLSQLVHSIREAGVTLVRGEFLPSVVQIVVGLALLSAPIVAVLLTSRLLAPAVPWRRRAHDLVTGKGLAPWLWFLLVYSAMVVVQRWDIDREVIARYWLPYWIVTAVVLGRCLIEWVALAPPVGRRALGVATAAVVLLAAYNIVEISITVRSNARDGVTLNAVRYQDSRALDALGRGDLDVLYTDHVQLVELQLYARDALVPITRLSCHPDDVPALVEELRAAVVRGEHPGVAIVGHCRGEPFVDDLLRRLDGATVVRDPGVGLVIRPAG